MARSVDRSIPPWATRSASEFSSAVVEPAVRRVVAERLGVTSADLAPEVSLTDELAADSLDLLELAVALEAEWGISIPDRTLQAVRTYRDVVDAVTACLVDGLPAGKQGPVPAPFAWTRVVPARDAPNGPLEHAGELTPYAVEVLVEEAAHAGPGARVEMELPASTDDAGLAAAVRQLSRLSARGVAVSVRRERRTPPAA
jgi:acyl carrier protein